MRPHVELIQQSDLCWHPAELHGGSGRAMQRNLSYDEEDGSCSTKIIFETAWDRPGGYHEADTEWFVLEGKVKMGSETFGPGMYWRAPAGLRVPDISVDKGTEVLIFREYGDWGFSVSETDKSENFESLRYEAFGPKNIALIIETLTNNKNRTASKIRTALQKFGGNLGSSGSTTHFFDNCGIIQISKEEISEEKALDFSAKVDAKDCISYKNFHEIITNKEDFYKIKTEAEKLTKNFIYSDIEWRPKTVISLKEREEMENMLELLEDNEDVQKIFHNCKFI